MSSRAGQFVQQPQGYRAFEPAPLPPDPSVRFDGALLAALSRADQALGRLDGTAGTLPNPDLFVAMYVRQEAVLSSQIEGTQASLTDVLAFEADEDDGSSEGDVEEVVNYVAAMNHGLRRLQEFPLSLRLIREIHERLMRGVRGQERQPGEFRNTQNWIGGSGSTVARRLLTWKEAENIPWGILLLFGGGIALAAGFKESSLSASLGSGLSVLTRAPEPLVILGICLSVTFLTEVTSNTATTALLMPILAATALSAGIAPERLMIPAALSASCAFMLPVATAPNAIIFGSRQVSAPFMARQGFILNILGAFLITGICVLLL